MSLLPNSTVLIDHLQKFYDDLPQWGKFAFAGCIAVVAYVPYRYITTLPRKTPIKADYKKGLFVFFLSELYGIKTEDVA